MGIGKTIILILFVFLGLNKEPRERFTYEEKPMLTWADFRGLPLKSVPYKASVNSGMGYSYSSDVTNGKVTAIKTVAHSYFYPEFSWKRDIDEQNASLLAHEQKHWEITELHTRMLRKQFAAYKLGKNPKADIQAIFTRVEQQRKAMQLQYDKETSHGLNKEAQKNWEILVTERLFKL